MSTAKHVNGMADMIDTAISVGIEELPPHAQAYAVPSYATSCIMIGDMTAKHIVEILREYAEKLD